MKKILLTLALMAGASLVQADNLAFQYTLVNNTPYTYNMALSGVSIANLPTSISPIQPGDTRTINSLSATLAGSPVATLSVNLTKRIALVGPLRSYRLATTTVIWRCAASMSSKPKYKERVTYTGDRTNMRTTCDGNNCETASYQYACGPNLVTTINNN